MKKLRVKFSLWVFTISAVSLVSSVKGIIRANVTRYENLLFNDLFKDYNKEIRPVLKESDPVRAEFGFAISEIIDLDEKNQILATNVWVRQKWQDMWLKWNPAMYDGITAINIDPKFIWKPDILLYNNVNFEDNGEQYLFNTKVVINHDGTVTWLSPNKLRSSCKIDIQHFPFDTQYCKVMFGSWTFDGSKLNLEFYQNSSKADMSNFVRNGEYELVSANAVRSVITYACCPAPYIDLTYTVKIRRRPLFYLNNLILPCIVLALLTSISFLFPPETGERISLVITVLLGMTVFMIVFTEAIPATSESTPLIGKYFAAVLFEIAFCLLATCLPLRLQHLHPGTEMPMWARVLIFDYIGTLMCYKCLKRKRTNSITIVRSHEDNNPKNDIKLTSAEIIENGYVREKRTLDKTLDENHKPLENQVDETRDVTPIVNYIKKTEKDDSIYAEWKDAISILDRLFFWIFIVTFLVSSLVILYGAPSDD